jgi:fructoselysine-6-P-deglycase FrlB-like protein
MSYTSTEIESQPGCWERAAELAGRHRDLLPQPGERVAVAGCGTSWFIGQSYAALREAAGLGLTDAFAASEFPLGRSYDRVVLLSRSGTTSEVVRLAAQLPSGSSSLAIVADRATPVAEHAAASIELDFADEVSVVQTRFATSALALLRASVGAFDASVVADARASLTEPLPAGLITRTRFAFLGTGWTIGLAHEAALKLREAAQAWTESYPAMEFRHGPLSVADERGAVVVLGAAPDGLADEVRALGAHLVESARDPMAQLITAQRLAVALAEARGLNPDRPRNLARSVILPAR